MSRKHSCYQCVLCLLFSLCILQKSNGLQWHWWNLGLLSWRSLRNNPAYIIAPTPMCNRIAGLTPTQSKLCQLYFDHMPSVSVGAQLGIRECRRQFKHRRWNCTTHDDSSAFGPITVKATKEAGFAYSISAAGVVHSIARSCKQARLRTCTCSDALRPQELHRDWIWGGCGDNLEYGFRFAEGFIDIREKEKNYPRYSKGLSRMLMNLHNNEAGRRAVYQLASVRCKCHGVSGSCSLKTCWQSLAPFEKVGQFLTLKYDTAIRVKFNKRGTKLRRGSPNFKRPTASDLIYLSESPDYCLANNELGTRGTRGRRCNTHSRGADGCDSLCCGRGYTSFSDIEVRDCRCKFYWCCEIKCSRCMYRVTVNICK